MLRVALRAGRAAATAAARPALQCDAAAAAAATPWDPLAALHAWLQPACGRARGIKTQGNEVRSGQVIEREGRLMEVLKAEYTQGQGRASGFVQLEARDLKTGAKRVERLRPSESVERVQLDRADYTFLYLEGKQVVLMHPTTFEQIELPRALLGDAGDFLAEGVPVAVCTGPSGEVVTAALPETVEAVVESCGASMKNERTDGKQTKPAVLANGATLQVPGFVKEGDIVILRPATGEFLKRKL